MKKAGNQEIGAFSRSIGGLMSAVPEPRSLKSREPTEKRPAPARRQSEVQGAPGLTIFAPPADEPAQSVDFDR